MGYVPSVPEFLVHVLSCSLTTRIARQDEAMLNRIFGQSVLAFGNLFFIEFDSFAIELVRLNSDLANSGAF